VGRRKKADGGEKRKAEVVVESKKDGVGSQRMSWH